MQSNSSNDLLQKPTLACGAYFQENSDNHCV